MTEPCPECGAPTTVERHKLHEHRTYDPTEARAAVLAAIKKHVYSLRVEEHGPVDWARNGVLSDILAFLDTDGLSDGGPTDG